MLDNRFPVLSGCCGSVNCVTQEWQKGELLQGFTSFTFHTVRLYRAGIEHVILHRSRREHIPMYSIKNLKISVYFL